MKIIEQFTNPTLRFCLLDKTEDIKQGKSPGIQKGWEGGLTLKEVANATKNNNRASENRIGIIGGHGNLRIIDVDKKGKWFESILVIIEAEFPKTLTITTISGGRHYYFYAKEMPNIDFKDDSGEIRANNRMVVAANSELCGKKYKIMKDLPIATLDPFLIEKFLSDYLLQKIEPTQPQEETPTDIKSVLDNQKDVKMQTLLDGNYSAWGSRSEAEASLVQKLIFKGLTKNQVFNIMTNYSKIGKWKDAPDGYKQMTYNKALSWQPKKEIPRETKKEQKLDLKDFNYFMNLKKDKRFLIEEFLYPKTIIMFYSPPGQFKSLLVLYAVMCIATGKKFLGMKTKQFPVLYCDKENNEQIIKQRLMGLYKGMGLKRRKFPLKLLIRNGDLQNLLFVEQLKAAVRENEVKLVVFDTLHRFSDYEENKADDINRLYTTVFQPLVNECDCAVMFLHHTNKEGGYRGSGDFLGMVDVSYSVKRPNKKEGRFKILNEKSRGGEIEDVEGEIDFGEEDDFYIKIRKLSEDVIKSERVQSISKKKEISNTIKAMFTEKGKVIQRTEIMDVFDRLEETEKKKFSVATIKRSLQYLVTTDQVKTDGKGNYTRLWESIGSWD